MKCVYALVLAACLFGSRVCASGQQPGSALSSEREIKALEDERNRAIVNGDAAALERMTSDDYTFITLRGELRTKADIVKGFQSGSFRYQSRTIFRLEHQSIWRYCRGHGAFIAEGIREREGLQRRLPIHQSLRQETRTLVHRRVASDLNST